MDESRSAKPFGWSHFPLVALVARLLCRELTQENEYLRTENRVLRSKLPDRVRFTDEERRSFVDVVLEMERKLMRQVVSIVQPDTILAWQRRLEKRKWDYSDRRKRKPGRPRTAPQVEDLVCGMARAAEWGYKRISGELKKVGIQISKSCVADILRRNGLPPSPERSGLSWCEFLSRHADVLLCADLFTQEVWTIAGLQTAYVFFVIHRRTRTVLLARATYSPCKEWMQQQVRNALWECDELGIKPRPFLHDNDSCFTRAFDAVLRRAGVRPLKTPLQAPNANPHAERWVRSARRECLNHFVLLGLGSLQRALDQYRIFFNEHRPHQGIGNRIPNDLRGDGEEATVLPSAGVTRLDDVQVEEFLGGLLRSYSRKAA